LAGLLENKRIVIIGGTSGIGLSSAKYFIKEGASVLALGSNPEKVEKAREILSSNAICIQGDATLEGTAQTACDTCIDEFGGLDGLYHVAGGSGRKWGDGPLHEMNLEAWNKTIGLNLTSIMLSNRAAIRYFLASRQTGTILNMGSVLGYSPAPRYFTTHAYIAAKSAIIGFSKSIASYYANESIRVNVIAPALTETPMAGRAANDQEILKYIKTKQPLDGGRISVPGDLDMAACYFLSDQSRFTTGQVLAVDGGWTISEGQHSGKT
jgi:NAD(P)-dependent dehydrogenase (short-subunit alcohol dehydrogenase family)